MRALTRLSLSGLAAALCAAAAVPLLSTQPAQAATPVVVVNHTFEDGTTQGWAPRGGETVAASTTAAHAGTGSLAVTGRTATWQGPSLNLLTTAVKGTKYTYSVWARLAAGEAATNVKLSIERRTAGTPSYEQIVGATAVTADGWVNLTGTYTLAYDVDFLSAYVESGSATAAFLLDDFTLSYEPETPIQTDIPRLKDTLATSFPIGAAISMPQILGNHGQLLSRHFDTVTPGNALKWDATEPSEGTFRYTDADAMVAFAQTNNMAVRGHTLVWHNQTPAWVFKDESGADMTATAENKALLLARLEAHIRAVVGRYGTRIGTWDVVNEVIDESQADGLRRSTWFNITGLDYIRTAFRVAREVAPTAKLYINDYNTNVPAKRDKLFDLVSQLRAEGVPIDGVGHQMHVNIGWPTVDETEAMIQKFVPLGVAQQVTEMDISIYTDNSESFPTPPQDRLTTQAYRYRDLFALYKRYASALTSVTLWGLADDETWLDTFPVTRKDAPLLFDTQLQAKSAYWGIVDPSRLDPTPTPTVSPTPTSTCPTPGHPRTHPTKRHR